MRRIRQISLAVTCSLLLAACGSQAPAPVSFGHRSGPLPRAVEPGPNPSAATISVAPGTVPETVTVQPGDTVYALSRRYNRPVRSIIDENGLQPPYLLQPGQQIRMAGGRFHTVQRGETLYSISRAYGVDLYSIAQTNDLGPPYTIAVGQQLRISSSGGSAIAAAPATAAPPAGEPSSRGVAVETLPPPSASPQPPAGAGSLPEVMVPPTREPAPSSAPAPSAPPASVPPAPPPTTSEPPAQPAPGQETAMPPRSGRTFSWPVRGRILSTFGPKADGLHNDGINISARAGAPVIAAENGIVVYAGNELRGFGNLLLVRHAGGWITAYAHLDRTLVDKGQRVSRGQAIGTVGSSGGVSQPQLHFEIRQGTQAVDPAKFLSVAMLDGLATPVRYAAAY